MTNTDLLLLKIDESGYKAKWVAEQLGLTYQGFFNKIFNKTEFKATEIATLKELLHLTDAEVAEIFFAGKVD